MSLNCDYLQRPNIGVQSTDTEEGYYLEIFNFNNETLWIVELNTLDDVLILKDRNGTILAKYSISSKFGFADSINGFSYSQVTFHKWYFFLRKFCLVLYENGLFSAEEIISSIYCEDSWLYTVVFENLITSLYNLPQVIDSSEMFASMENEINYILSLETPKEYNYLITSIDSSSNYNPSNIGNELIHGYINDKGIILNIVLFGVPEQRTFSLINPNNPNLCHQMLFTTEYVNFNEQYEVVQRNIASLLFFELLTSHLLRNLPMSECASLMLPTML